MSVALASPDPIKIALLEDDAVLADILSEYLSEFYTVELFYSSDEALDAIEQNEFDLLIFDINILGSMNGLELLAYLRSFSNNIPTIVITAYDDIEHLKKAFSSGATDFMRKPFELEELRVRIEHIAKLFHIQDQITIDADTLFFPKKFALQHGNQNIKLSPKDSKILEYLIRNKQRVVSSQELMQNLWEYDEIPSEATLRSHIRTLRNLIGKEKIKTIRGTGYQYE